LLPRTAKLKPPPALQLDFSLINRIYRDSEEVRELLGENIDSEFIEDDDSPPPPAPPQTPATGDEWSDFLTQANAAELEFLRAISVTGELPDLQLERIARSHQMMATLLMDGMNERAFDLFGASLIFMENDVHQIEESDLIALRTRLNELEQQ
jgi:hypothetical protein